MWQTLTRRLRSELDPRARGKATALIARAPMAVSAVLGLAIVAQAAGIALSLSTEITALPGAHSAVTIDPRERARRGLQLQDVAAAHLFGVAPQELAAANTRVVTRSPLVLTGIIATSNPSVGFAIVGSRAAGARTVYVGSLAAPGTVLAAVYPQWVVLRRGGQRLTLRLLRKDPPGHVRTGGGGMLARDASAPMGADDGNSGGGGGGGGEFALPAYLPRPKIPDGAAVVQAFALRPTNVDGQQGELISGTSLNHKSLAALGLSPGDVITQINGIPVGAPNTPDLLSAIQSGGATLMVVKDGQESSVTLDPGSVAEAAAFYRQVAPW